MRVGLADGTIDIVIGTHALLGKNVKFKDLALLVVDEEQHFGVAHKEKLKTLRSEVHVLTLTATPIPRTLQLALTGVRDLSIIASPPVDRLAVRTFVSPFDPITVREALLREKYRGGQAFYVCPRTPATSPAARIFSTRTFRKSASRLRTGRCRPPRSTTSCRPSTTATTCCSRPRSSVSGLDIPTANTLIVHRADRFGLAQLYQLRGRVGRAKLRAYALLTPPTESRSRRRPSAG